MTVRRGAGKPTPPQEAARESAWAVVSPIYEFTFISIELIALRYMRIY
jgi:hypothetical protein